MNISELSSQAVNNVDSQQSNVSQSEKTVAQEQLQKEKDKVEKRNEEKAEELSQKEFKKVTEKLNETVQTFHEDLQFQIHEETDIMMAKLVNTKKHETIKEMPPKDMLDMLGQIKKMVGLIIDEKI
ncbi:flagellar protein FlaG [Halanaerobacter jeridensis]|uniref:Flagellar protein FlaG n=1 Tax=Halanaerobacter jeridensis TaxID=706427 RepID=A0A938XXU6_9FIRM|nr:flagellar protein FlaG [Halanaerobacter jeridensis]MBM7557280.1 flagellar protein FlaG [Halanaerobacter jeridensis]